MPKNKKNGFKILTNNDEVCIPSLSSILLTVLKKVAQYPFKIHL